MIEPQAASSVMASSAVSGMQCDVMRSLCIPNENAMASAWRAMTVTGIMPRDD
ncbi:hypothetical protein ACV229_37075 [Burkholderia sp. MR1-5-21]